MTSGLKDKLSPELTVSCVHLKALGSWGWGEPGREGPWTVEPPTPRLRSQPLWAEAQRAGPRGRSPLTPVRELLVVAVFRLVGQRVQVVATTTFPNHVLLEAGADTGLGGWEGAERRQT